MFYFLTLGAKEKFSMFDNILTNFKANVRRPSSIVVRIEPQYNADSGQNRARECGCCMVNVIAIITLTQLITIAYLFLADKV